MVRTKMPETATGARKNNPIAWFRLTVLQRTVYGDTLCTGLSLFAVVRQRRQGGINTHRTKKRSRLLAAEILRDRCDMRNIRNLFGLMMRN